MFGCGDLLLLLVCRAGQGVASRAADVAETLGLRTAGPGLQSSRLGELSLCSACQQLELLSSRGASWVAKGR